MPAATVGGPRPRPDGAPELPPEPEAVGVVVERVREPRTEGVGRSLCPDLHAVAERPSGLELPDALDRGLVDEIGTRETVEDRVAERIGEPIAVREFEPTRSLRDRVQIGAQRATYAFGAGLASAFDDDADGLRFRR